LLALARGQMRDVLRSAYVMLKCAPEAHFSVSLVLLFCEFVAAFICVSRNRVQVGATLRAMRAFNRVEFTNPTVSSASVSWVASDVQPSCHISIATDGVHVFVRTVNGLYKFGTGSGGTSRGSLIHSTPFRCVFHVVRPVFTFRLYGWYLYGVLVAGRAMSVHLRSLVGGCCITPPQSYLRCLS
jgi:hypothetical protein